MHARLVCVDGGRPPVRCSNLCSFASIPQISQRLKPNLQRFWGCKVRQTRYSAAVDADLSRVAVVAVVAIQDNDGGEGMVCRPAGYRRG